MNIPLRLIETAAPGVSRYASLAHALRARVVAGEWSPGSALPAESQLAKEHSVALGTMRRAAARKRPPRPLILHLRTYPPRDTYRISGGFRLSNQGSLISSADTGIIQGNDTGVRRIPGGCRQKPGALGVNRGGIQNESS